MQTPVPFFNFASSFLGEVGCLQPCICSRWTDTVKAFNFGPHGNFGLFLTSSVASVDEPCTKSEENRICRSEVFLELLFSSFFCRTRFNDSKPFRKRGPKFPWGPKLGALTVLSRTRHYYLKCALFSKYKLTPSCSCCSKLSKTPRF
jgi:hypothetical protein